MAILHLHHLARHVPLRQLNCWTSIRTASTVVGKSGRIYIEGDLLRRRRDDRNTFKAESGNESFVLKHVPTPFYRLSTFLPRVFSGARRLRLAVDSSDDDNVLVYPYFRGTLFDLIQANPDLSVANRKEILRHLAEAIQELHSKDLIHLDVKPQNVFVNWTCNEDGTKTITDVALADLWHAQRSERGEPYEPRFPVGDMAWRSLEAHVGRAITKASDMYSFGLVCAYAFGGGDMLLLRDEINEQELQIGSVLEAKVLTEVLSMRLAYFGLPTEGLLEKLDHWSEAFKTYSRLANQVLKITPELRFEVWGASFGSKARDMILGLTKSDPAARLTVDQVLAHPWWEKQDPRPPLRLLYPIPNPATTEAFQQDLLTNAADPSRSPSPTKNLLLSATLFNYVEWMEFNFPRAAGFIQHDLGPFQTDITFTFPDEATGLPTRGTIPAAQTRLRAIGRVGGDPRARDEDGKKRGGIVCVALYAIPPDSVYSSDGAGWQRRMYGMPAMEAAEKALEEACRVLGEKGYGEHRAAGREAMEGCMGVVVMGPDMSISEYSDERGFYDTPGELVEEMVYVEVGGEKK